MKTNPEQIWKGLSVGGHLIGPIDPSEVPDSKRIQDGWMEGNEPIELIVGDTKLSILSIAQEGNQGTIAINAPQGFELNPATEQEIRTLLSAFAGLLLPQTEYKIAA